MANPDKKVMIAKIIFVYDMHIFKLKQEMWIAIAQSLAWARQSSEMQLRSRAQQQGTRMAYLVENKWLLHGLLLGSSKPAAALGHLTGTVSEAPQACSPARAGLRGTRLQL